MTGMKEGAGEDPFAEDDTTDEEPERDTRPTDEATEGDNAPSSKTTASRSNRRRQQSMEIPYKFRRDGVQDGRDRVPLFLMPETKRAERDARRELEERFDDDISLTDVREALMKTGLQHLDEVEEHLEEWGYGMTFE